MSKKGHPNLSANFLLQRNGKKVKSSGEQSAPKARQFSQARQEATFALVGLSGNHLCFDGVVGSDE